MAFARDLSIRYKQAGYEVFSKHLSEVRTRPPGWIGAIQDLVIIKGNKRTAIFRESHRTILDPSRLALWKQARIQNGCHLFLYVGNHEELELLGTILRQEGLEADLAIIGRHRSGKRTSRINPRKIQARRWAIIISTCILAALLILWISKMINGYSPIWYEPRDLERQVDDLKDKVE